jgi:hypothetical protein
MRLGTMLREYDIRSMNIRFGEPIGRVKGYYRADFTDAWTRYCPATPGEPYQPYQAYHQDDHPRPDSETGPVRLPGRYGSSRTGQQAVPGQKPALTCDDTRPGTTGTAGTAPSRFDLIDGGAA